MSEVRSADLSSLRIQRSPVQETPKKPWGKIIGAIIILAIIVGAWSYVRTMSFSAIEVDIASANMVSASQSNAVLTASGYVVAQRKAAVSSRVSGRLVDLRVIEGDEVKQNQIIGRIESADVEATLSQLRAALDLAKSDLEAAVAELEDAKLDFDRKKSLADAGAATRTDLDVAKTRLRRAEAGHNGRQAAIKMAEANIRNAEVQVENTVLRSPFDGTVLTKNANVGEVITVLGAAAGSRGAVVTIADMNSLEVEADVSESNLERVSQNQPCEVTLDAYPEKRYAAFISKVIPTADRAKATVQVKIRFQERDSRVLPEMSAKVLFLKSDVAATKEDSRPRLVVPSAAIRAHDAKQFVFTFVEDHVKEVQVQVGEAHNGLTEITSGIKAGDKVVVSPAENVKDGSKVELRK